MRIAIDREDSNFNLVQLTLDFPPDDDGNLIPVMLAGDLVFWNSEKGRLWMWNGDGWKYVDLQGARGEIKYYRIGQSNLLSVYNYKRSKLFFYSPAVLSGDHQNIEPAFEIDSVSPVFRRNNGIFFIDQGGVCQLMVNDGKYSYVKILRWKKPLNRRFSDPQFVGSKGSWFVVDNAFCDGAEQFLYKNSSGKYLVRKNSGDMVWCSLSGKNAEILPFKWGRMTFNEKIYALDNEGNLTLLEVEQEDVQIKRKFRIVLDDIVAVIMGNFIVGRYGNGVRVVSEDGEIVLESRFTLETSGDYVVDEYGIAFKARQEGVWFVL